MNTIDHIYIINLESRTDKREYMIKQMKLINWDNYTIIKAIRPTINDVNEWNKNYLCDLPEDNRIGALGCLKSHMYVYNDALDKGYERIIVLEDDCTFIIEDNEQYDLQAKINKLLGKEPYDVVWLGGNHRRRGIKITNNLYVIGKTLATHAMLVTKDFMKHTLKYIKGTPHQIDVFFWKNAQKNMKKRCLAITPRMVYQKVGVSDIEGKWVNVSGETDYILTKI